jgi:hypothetical protein
MLVQRKMRTAESPAARNLAVEALRVLIERTQEFGGAFALPVYARSIYRAG